jgi:hypothetical protein
MEAIVSETPFPRIAGQTRWTGAEVRPDRKPGQVEVQRLLAGAISAAGPQPGDLVRVAGEQDREPAAAWLGADVADRR